MDGQVQRICHLDAIAVRGISGNPGLFKWPPAVVYANHKRFAVDRVFYMLLHVVENSEPRGRMMKVHNKYHGTAPRDAIYIGRGSPYGNPFVIGDPHPDTGAPMTRDDVCDLFEERTLPLLDLSGLEDRDLVCFCKPKRCHGDSLLAAANSK